MAEPGAKLTLAELSERSGLPGRTIRYYIAQGLLAGPGKAGRGAVYSERHLGRLEEIRRFQEQGLTLREIAGVFAESGGEREVWASEAQHWVKYRLADDVEVQLRGDMAPWRLRLIRRELSRLAAALGAAESTEDL